MVRCITCNVLHMRQLCRFLYCFSMIWYCRIQSPAVSKERHVRWCGFRQSIPLSIGYVWNSSIDMAISILVWSYCICIIYWQNHRSILPNFLLFAWFDTLEFNRLQCSNNKIYDDVDFAVRFRYQLHMFRIRVLIWLSWLLHAHIAYITDGAKSLQHSAECPIVCTILYGWMQSSAVFKQQDVRWYGCQWSILISIDYLWSVFIHEAISTPWYSYCIWNSYIKNDHW